VIAITLTALGATGPAAYAADASHLGPAAMTLTRTDSAVGTPGRPVQISPLHQVVLSETANGTAISVYTYNYYYACSTSNCTGARAWVWFNATYSGSQVWINGTVHCGSSYFWQITWCGQTNNGVSYLNTGANFNQYYLRMNIFANDGGCVEWGNAPQFATGDCEVHV
jgi:hypothetical protein